MIEAGYYSAAVTGIEFGEASTGTEGIGVQFELLNNGERTGASRKAFLWLSPNAKQYTIDKLKRIGFNGDIDNPAWSDEPIEVECRHEVYDGTDREKWDIAGGGGVQPLTDDKRRRLKSSLRAEFGTSPAAKPSATADTKRKAPSRPAPTQAKELSFSSADEAYDHCVTKYGDQFSDDGWFKAIETVASDTGVAEADFNSEHWKRVVEASDPIPF
ncbi:MAG: hypothetical protein AAGB51_12360 [Planctomycetota bacterium]